MKILMVCQREFAHHYDKAFAGIQKVELDQIHLLNRFGEDVYAFATSDSVFHDGITTFPSSASSLDKEQNNSEKIRNTKKRRAELVSILANNEFDCVICHNWSTSLQTVFTKEFPNIPTIVYAHNTPKFVGGIQIFGRIEQHKKLMASGALVMTVSDSCRERWKKYLDGWDVLHPGYIENVKDFSQPRDRSTIIARLSPEKKVIHGLNMLHEGGFPPVVLMTTTPRTESEEKILKAVNKKYPNIKIIFDASREEIFDNLSRSVIHCIPSEESFSLVGLEAQTCGTPILIFDKEGDIRNAPHEIVEANEMYNISSLDLPLSDNDNKNPSNLKVVDHYNIASNTLQKYNPEAAYKRLMEKVNKAIKMRTNKTSNILEFAE